MDLERINIMKRIAVITQGVALQNEKGYTRFKSIADILAKCGYEVDLVTSTFQHWDKKQRNISQLDMSIYDFKVKFIYEPGYKKNIDLRRLYSHSVLAKNLIKYLKSNAKYDLIYSEIPPNNVAKKIARYCEKEKIPYIVDVNDLWPEAMRMVIDIPVVSNILFAPLLYDAEYVYSKISGVIGTSDEYRDRPFKKKDRTIPRETVYVGNDLSDYDAGVTEFFDKIHKDKNEFWVTYAGTLGESYDLETMILAADLLNKKGYEKIKIYILGGGPKEESLRELAKSKMGKVEFVGYLPYKKMAAYLSKSDIVVNSFVKKAPQSIVTKIGDYLASGNPMINTCSSKEFRNKVDKDGFGVNIEAENAEVLANTIISLYEDIQKRELMGEKARQIAEQEFDRKNSYLKICSLIESVIKR